MIKRAFLLSAMALGSSSVFAAVTGSCLDAAQKFQFISTSPNFPNRQIVSLTAAYDDETGTYDPSNQVCYLKATLTRSQAYTVWLEDTDGKAIEFYEIAPVPVPEDDEESVEPGAMFEEISGNWGSRMVMTKDEWYVDEEDPEMSDPASWTYYFMLSGAKGETATFCYVKSVALPEGIEENPRVITVKETEQEVFSKPSAFVTNEFSYAFQTAFEAGRRYLFATEGGTAEHPYDISFGDGKITRYADWETAGNAAYSFDPSADDEEGVFSVYQSAAGSDAVTFNLRYRVLPERTIAEHHPGELEIGGSVQVTPGRINDTENRYYDDIIDGPLYGFRVEKGERYLVETTGAQTNLLLRIYDSDGEVLYENTECGDGSGNVCRGFTASATGKYYVGLAVNLADDDLDDPGETTATLRVLDGASVEGSPDEWDDADDTADGATVLDACPYGEDISRAVKQEVEGEEKIVSVPIDPSEVDTEGTSGWHRLGRTDWRDVFVINARKGLRYRVRVRPQQADEARTTLSATVYRQKGSTVISVSSWGTVNYSDALLAEEPLTFTATENAPYYIRLSVAEGNGLSYPAYKVYTAAYDPEVLGGEYLGRLKVVLNGTEDGSWSVGSESVKYASGASIVLPVGSCDVKFTAVKGFSTPATVEDVEIDHDECATVEAWYNDTFDPKDDTPAGATALTLATSEKSVTRTLWRTDAVDNFALTTKDGYYYDLALAETGDQDAVFTIYDADGDAVAGAKDVTSVHALALPAEDGKYRIAVTHAKPAEPGDTAYILSGFYANVGAIKFAKTSVTTKDTATSVALTVNRTAKDGRVSVSYATADGTAKAGEHYVAQSGTLVWENGDNKAKTITVKLIPKAGAWYDGGEKSFSVTLADAGGDYPASIVGGATATVTRQETSKATVSADDVYAKKAAKPATVKTEDGALRGGTFYGVVTNVAPGSALLGFAELGSVTLTVSAKGGVSDTSKDSISAKVVIAGKTYTFKTASKEDAWDEETPTLKTRTLTMMIKSGSEYYENTLTLAVADGATTDEDAWRRALATARLTLGGVDYAGTLYRQNAKIQDYLDAAVDFAGYYTVALANPNGDAEKAPAGNGYLTLTVDSKGTAKVAGLLPDATKLSLSVTAAAIVSGAKDDEMLIPVFAAKSPYAFGGTLRLRRVAVAEAHLDGRDYDTLVDAPSGTLAWNNDNASATYAGEEGWSLSLVPAGGWYDTVYNLQNHYRTMALTVSTAKVADFATEALPTGYSYVTTTENDPDGYAVDLAGDTLATAKKALVKETFNTKLVDLDASTNPFNVQVKLVRATGIVTGSFSLWSESVDGSAQKEITGIKHYGVVVLERDAAGVLPQDVFSAGFCNQTVKVKDVSKTRSWTLSKPFNILMSEYVK